MNGQIKNTHRISKYWQKNTKENDKVIDKTNEIEHDSKDIENEKKKNEILIFGTWNVRMFIEADKIQKRAEQLKQYNVGITGIEEAR